MTVPSFAPNIPNHPKKSFLPQTVTKKLDSSMLLHAPNSSALPSSKDLPHNAQREQGYVHRFAANSGWGFIRASTFHGDLFFHRDNVMTDYKSTNFLQGDKIEFTIIGDNRGRPHAVDVKPLLNRSPLQLLGKRCTGIVRRLEERWGFINSAAFDGDLFLHKDNLLPHQNVDFAGYGTPCEFDVVVDSRGRCVAKWVATKLPSEPADWLNQGRIRGFLKSFQDRWGFINSDKFHGDLFVHKDSIESSLKTISVGVYLEFEVELDRADRGARLIGTNVRVLDHSDLPPLSLKRNTRSSKSTSYSVEENGNSKSTTDYYPYYDMPHAHPMVPMYSPMEPYQHYQMSQMPQMPITTPYPGYESYPGYDMSAYYYYDYSNYYGHQPAHGAHQTEISHDLSSQETPTTAVPSFPASAVPTTGASGETVPAADGFLFNESVKAVKEPFTVGQTVTTLEACESMKEVDSVPGVVKTFNQHAVLTIAEIHQSWCHVKGYKENTEDLAWLPANLLKPVQIFEVTNTAAPADPASASAPPKGEETPSKLLPVEVGDVLVCRTEVSETSSWVLCSKLNSADSEQGHVLKASLEKRD